MLTISSVLAVAAIGAVTGLDVEVISQATSGEDWDAGAIVKSTLIGATGAVVGTVTGTLVGSGLAALGVTAGTTFSQSFAIGATTAAVSGIATRVNNNTLNYGFNYDAFDLDNYKLNLEPEKTFITNLNDYIIAPSLDFEAVTMDALMGGIAGGISFKVNEALNKRKTSSCSISEKAKIKGRSATENPRDYLDEALERQGLEKTPKRLKEKWTDGEYNYEVRIHKGNSKYTDADSIYRVSRQKVPDPDPKVQGSGKEYLGSDGKWYHERELIEFNKNGTPNPLYNEHSAEVTHISVD